MFDFKTEISNLPDSPGVYLMKNKDDKIIYIGKAINLKNRVKSYFQKSSQHSQKVVALVSHIESFEYIITDTDLEALILECNLIKLHQPQYNILLKDDKTRYPYIKITINEEYPKMLLARKIEKDGAKYFGPFYGAGIINETINTIEKIFALKTCNKNLPKDVGKSRPCINYQIGRCLAPCAGGVNKDEYRSMMIDIIKFLNGQTDEIVRKLQSKMKHYSQQLEFERAAEYRDKIDMIVNKIAVRQKITDVQSEDIDVIGLSQNETDSCIQLFFIRGGNIIGRDFFILEGTGSDDIDEIVSGFLKQFYESMQLCPATILLPAQPSDTQLMENWLYEKRGSKVTLKNPQKGEKKELVNMASRNAELQLRNFSIRCKGIKQDELKTLERFTELFELDKVPVRIEAYDISNTGTQEIVASMIVFENGKANKKEYKRFNIKNKGVQGDLEYMKEVLTRRFSHKEIKLPDVIMADGGALHEKMVRTFLNETALSQSYDDLKNISVFGMVKDDRHRTRGLISRGKEYDLKNDLDIFRFVTSIQNEAHRFALEYNKNLRDKRYKASLLDNIPGIGKAKKITLLKKFGSVANIKKATKEELMETKGINEELADKIFTLMRTKDGII